MTTKYNGSNDDEKIEEQEELKPEKRDLRAITIAAFLTFLPPVLLFIGALYLIIYLIFLR